MKNYQILRAAAGVGAVVAVTIGLPALALDMAHATGHLFESGMSAVGSMVFQESATTVTDMTSVTAAVTAVTAVTDVTSTTAVTPDPTPWNTFKDIAEALNEALNTESGKLMLASGTVLGTAAINARRKVQPRGELQTGV
jgi:hypothetical protein